MVLIHFCKGRMCCDPFSSVDDKALVKWPDILILSHLSRSRQEFSFFILFLEEMEENVSSTDPLITYGILAH